MSGSFKLIEGEVEDPRDTLIAELQAELVEVRNEARVVRDALQLTRQEQRTSVSAIVSLRRQLSPLYRALQEVFGDLDAAGVDESAGPPSFANQHAPAAGNPRVSAVWDSWKQKLPGGPAKIIDALLVHTEMNTQQLAIATGVHRNSIPTMIYKLNRAGLINKNGGRFSLKQL